MVASVEPGREIHIIADNLSAHKTKAGEAFLSEHPDVHLHFTPTYSSWLNQVEIWFSKNPARHHCSRRLRIQGRSRQENHALYPPLQQSRGLLPLELPKYRQANTMSCSLSSVTLH